MPSSAIFLLVVAFVILASTNGFKIGIGQPLGLPGNSAFFTTSAPQVSKFGTASTTSFLNQPIAGYPKVPPPNAYESGGHEDDLLPPFEDGFKGFTNLKSPSFRRSIEDVKVDPKTGYPLVAEPSWKYAGGNEENLELPLEDSRKAEEQEAVDPKTGYPLVAQPSWQEAGGDETILELPFEELEKPLEEDAVDPKTGYPLVAQPGWAEAGGDGDILNLPFEDSNEQSVQEEVDPKTGYPLIAQPGWKNAGGNEEIIELPLEDSPDGEVATDPKTGYPLVAQPGWKDAGGNEDILELPLEDKPAQEEVDPKTGYPLVAQPGWKDAGGDGDILELPVEDQPAQEKVDPKTGYPLVAQPGWKDAGGNEDILELPLEESNKNLIPQIDVRSGVDIEEQQLTELRPPPLENNTPILFTNALFASDPASRRSFQQNPGFPQVQKRNSAGGLQQPSAFLGGQNRPIESSYSYTGPENVVVTVTRFLNTDSQEKRNYQPNNPLDRSGSVQSGFKPQSNSFGRQTSNQHVFETHSNSQSNKFQPNGVAKLFQSTPHRNEAVPLQQTHSNFNSRHS